AVGGRTVRVVRPGAATEVPERLAGVRPAADDARLTRTGRRRSVSWCLPRAGVVRRRRGVPSADRRGREDLDGRRARGLGRRQDPRALARAALRERGVRRYPRLRDVTGSGGLASGGAPRAALPQREALPHGPSVLL